MIIKLYFLLLGLIYAVGFPLLMLDIAIWIAEKIEKKI